MAGRKDYALTDTYWPSYWWDRWWPISVAATVIPNLIRVYNIPLENRTLIVEAECNRTFNIPEEDRTIYVEPG